MEILGFFFPSSGSGLCRLRLFRRVAEFACVAHTLVIRSIRKLSKQSLNHHLSKWFIFLVCAMHTPHTHSHRRERTHVDCRCHSVVCVCVRLVLVLLPFAIATIVLWTGNFHLLLRNGCVEIKLRYYTLRNSRITISTARWGCERAKWNEDEVQKNAFQRQTMCLFVRFASFFLSLSFVFILNCTHVLLNERTKW